METKTEFKITDKLSDMKAALSSEYQKVYREGMRKRGTHKSQSGMEVRNHIASREKELVVICDNDNYREAFEWDGTKREIKQAFKNAKEETGFDDITVYIDGRVDEYYCSPREYMQEREYYDYDMIDHFGISITK